MKNLPHSAIATRQQLCIELIDAFKIITNNDHFEATKAQTQKRESALEQIKNSDEVVVRGGFNSQGREDKIATIQYTHKNKVTCLGICLVMQCDVIEYAGNVQKNPHAHSSKFIKEFED